MNWNEIADKYPEAYKDFHSWATDEACSHWCDRDLYDFFDEQGITVNVTKYPSHGFAYRIDDGQPCAFSHELSEKRTQAELTAFTEAFKIYESRRNRKTNS